MKIKSKDINGTERILDLSTDANNISGYIYAKDEQGQWNIYYANAYLLTPLEEKQNQNENKTGLFSFRDMFGQDVKTIEFK